MRHLAVIVAVICAVIGDGWAQERGNVRYIPPEDFDDDITRAPRQSPTRGAAVRRQRPTKAPEPAAEERAPYQPPEIPTRTVARRVPQRENPPQFIAPPSPALTEGEPTGYAPPVEDTQAPSAGQEGRTQGKRRRRPKKRRRPQNAVPKAEEPNKQDIREDKTPITELINDDQKRSERFQNPTLRNSHSTYNLDSPYQPEKAPWENNPTSEQRSNTAGYYKPQPGTNRLPVAESEPVGNTQGYSEPSPAIPESDAPAPYVPKVPETSVPNDASYVPILPPVRVPSEGASRLPPQDYPSIRNKERPTLNVNYNTPLRPHGGTLPVADPEEIIRNTGDKPVHNIIPQPDEPAQPVRGHSVRLPEVEKPILSPEYAAPGYDSTEVLTAPNAKALEGTYLDNLGDIQGTQRFAGRRRSSAREDAGTKLHLDHLGDIQGTQRNAGRRQELTEASVRSPRPSYSNTKPQEYDNDAEVDRKQTSQYRPPLQRAGSRYKPEDSNEPVRSRSQEQTPSTSVPRTRGLSRYQPTDQEHTEERTRGSSRTHSSTALDNQASRSSAAQPPIRTRGPQRYSPETAENVPITSSRRQTANAEEIPKDIPTEDNIRSQQRTPSHSPRNRQRPTTTRVESEPVEHTPPRNTLRSRPQFEIRDTEPSDSYEESVEDPNVYNPDYQLPSHTNPRGRTPYRTLSQPQDLPPRTEYQSPAGQQQHRQEFQYESPQNPRSRHQPQYVEPQNPRSRYQPQYEAPQNPRTQRIAGRGQEPAEASYSSAREDAGTKLHLDHLGDIQSTQRNAGRRSPGRARHQSSEPSPAPRRSSGVSNFKCPDAFGFYADPVQCDKYYECRNGTAEMHLCSDGLAFNQISAPKFLRCDSLRDVDCKSRPELQEPQPTKNCPRKFGLFPHETDCTKFWNCVDGSATEVQCPPGLTYSDERATCDWADLVESSCKSEDLLGFTCPEPTAHDLIDGVYTRYAHPNNCQLHYTCIKGADGQRRPRMLSCTDGLVFDPTSSSCRRPEEVPGCEDFYGVRSPPPKRKPARQPESEPEEIEEPTPRPRRRGSIRRSRN